MKRTVPTVIRSRVPNQDPEQMWVWAQEIIPALREVQDFLNGRYVGYFSHTTEGTATFETAWTSDTVPGSATWEVDARIVARATDGSSALYWVTGLFKRVSSAALAQVGSTASVVTAIEDVAGWDVQLTTSGNAVILQVKGDAARTVKWAVMPSLRELVNA